MTANLRGCEDMRLYSLIYTLAILTALLPNCAPRRGLCVYLPKYRPCTSTTIVTPERTGAPQQAQRLGIPRRKDIGLDECTRTGI